MQGDALTIQGDALTIQGDVLTMQGDVLTMQGDALTMQGDAFVQLLKPFATALLVSQPPALSLSLLTLDGFGILPCLNHSPQ